MAGNIGKTSCRLPACWSDHIVIVVKKQWMRLTGGRRERRGRDENEVYTQEWVDVYRYDDDDCYSSIRRKRFVA